jgi:glutamate-1-semialdehyde 2,1-aminomutase
MSVLDPTQDRLPFPLSGTFSANPISMTAGRIAMEYFDREAVEKLNQLGDYARQQVANAIQASGFPASVTGAGSMFRIHFKPDAPTGYRSAYQDANELSQMTFLVDYLYEHGFIMINTCSAALSTVLTQSNIDQMSATLEAGLIELKRR